MWRQPFLSATASWVKRMHFYSHCFNWSLGKMWSWQMEGGHLQRHTSHWVFLSPPLQWYSGDASSPDSHDQGHRRPSRGGVCQSLLLQGKDTPFSSIYSQSFLSFHSLASLFCPWIHKQSFIIWSYRMFDAFSSVWQCACERRAVVLSRWAWKWPHSWRTTWTVTSSIYWAPSSRSAGKASRTNWLCRGWSFRSTWRCIHPPSTGSCSASLTEPQRQMFPQF